MSPPPNDDAPGVLRRLLPELRLELDDLLLKDHSIAALKLLRERLGVSLGEAISLYGEYSVWLEQHWPELARRRAEAADPRLWKEHAVAALDALERVPVAIEALWDGDSYGWMLRLSAILPGASPEHPRFTRVSLGVFRGRGGDMRLFNGQVPPWPEAVVATEVAARAQARWNIPFHFPSPSTPDIDLPQWWDTLGPAD